MNVFIKADLKINVEDKIPEVSRLVNNTATFNTKIGKVENKIPDVTAIDRKIGEVENNKIPDLSDVVTNTAFNKKIREIQSKNPDHDHDKYITTDKFNKFCGAIFED